MTHLTVELLILHNTDDARVHTYIGTNPKKIDSLLAQVICPKFGGDGEPLVPSGLPLSEQPRLCAEHIVWVSGTEMEKEVGSELVT